MRNGFFPCLRRKNAAAAAAKDGTAEFPLLCPKYGQERVISARNFQIEIIDQPDAKTQR